MNKINQEKLKMWQEKLKKLISEHKSILQQRDEEARTNLGDDSALQSLEEDAETYQVRIDEVKEVIEKLEKDK